MKRVLLWLLLLAAGATSAVGQCHCVKLHLAIDDNRVYRYRYYVVGSRDTVVVQVRSATDQAHYGLAGGVRMHEAYGTKDPETGRDTIRSYDDRPYLLVPLHMLPQQQAFDQTTVAVEVTAAASGRTMTLRFSHWGFDDEYNLLVDFAPGRRYHLDLRPLSTDQPEAAGRTLAGLRPVSVAGTGILQWLKLRRP